MMKNVFAAGMVVVAFAAQAQSTEQLAFSDLQTRAAGPNGGTAIVGVAVNTTAKTLTTVFVTFNLYDAQNSLVGNAFATVNGLEPGVQWRFEAPAPAAFTTYKVAKVLAY